MPSSRDLVAHVLQALLCGVLPMVLQKLEFCMPCFMAMVPPGNHTLYKNLSSTRAQLCHYGAVMLAIAHSCTMALLTVVLIG